MGVVYRAMDPLLNRYVAIKVMIPEIVADDELRDRFMREARAAGSLQHPNIITIYDFGDADGHLYIAMEYVEGSDLSEIMERKDPLPLPGKLDIMIDVLHALDYAHSRQLVHRDVKPANIRVSVDGHAKLMDFGIARLEKSDLTKSGMTIGTPDYMAPEQITSDPITFATDVFAVGVVLYEFLTGLRTFDAGSLHAVFFQIINKQPPPLKEVAPGLPQALQGVLDTALAKDPKARYASAGAMARELTTIRTALSGAATVRVLARATPLIVQRIPEAAKRPERRPKALWIGAGGGLLVVAAGLWLALSPHGGKAPAAERTPAAASAPATTAPVPAPAPAEAEGRREPLPPASTSTAERRSGAEPRQAAAASPPPASFVAPASKQAAQLAAQPAAAQPAIQQAAPPAAQPVTQAPPASPPVLPPTPVAAPAPAAESPQAVDPRPQIEQLVDSYARAIESRSVAAIRRVYPGLTGPQQQGWEQFFPTVKSMRVQLAIAQLTVSGGSADLTAAGSYDFDTNAGPQHQAVSFHATASLEGGAWRLRTLR